MKAAVYERYGPPEVVQIREVAKPVPKDDEILIRVHATTVTSGDARMRAFRVEPIFWLPYRLFMGITKPKNRILGMVFAGEVEAVGKDVARFKPGDQVFGHGIFGGHAEYKAIRETAAVARKPRNLSYEEAAAIPFGASAAFHFLKKAGIGSGRKVLVNGASGGVGVQAVQLARHLGAEVTGVCGPGNLELVKSLGAEKIIDYTKEDFTQTGETWDIILDTLGTTSFSRCKGVLAPEGRHVFLVTGLRENLQALWTSVRGGRKVIVGVAPDDQRVMETIRELAEAGTLRPVIDRRYPLERIAEAHAHVDGGHKQGSVVVTLEHLIGA